MATETARISPRDAMRTALQMFTELFSDGEIHQARVEEVGLSEDGNDWNVTIGFNRKTPMDAMKGTFHDLFASDLMRDRQYKRVVLSAADGQLKRIEIRQL